MKRTYTITTEPLQINQAGKDTALFKSAGARKVVWLQTHSEHLKRGIEEALSHFSKNDSVLIEGNSFLHAHVADISVLVTTPRETKIKRSTREIVSRIDLAVINIYADDRPDDVMKTRERLHQIGCYAPVHIINPLQDNYTPNEVFLDHLKEMLGQPVQS